LDLALEVQTRYKEIPINAYKIVQTGPNTKFGGENEGLVRVAYQVGIEENVKNDPKIPAPSESKTANIKSGQFLTLSIILIITNASIKYNDKFSP